MLKTGQGARRQPVLFAMVTAGYDRESICWQIHDYALKVLAGIIKDESFLGVIYAAEEGDDWLARELLIQSRELLKQMQAG